MHKTLIIILSLISNFVFAQFISISKVEKTSNNNDKFLYHINPEITNADYLGEIEVEGFTNHDAEVFSQVYKKAKTFGANAFAIKKQETIDSGLQKFDPSHYILSMYYIAESPREDNAVYIISSSEKVQDIVVDGKKISVQPRSYIKKQLKDGEVSSISTGKFLGSKIMLASKQNQPVQYFQIVPGGIHADRSGVQGGLNLKSGDIILLEKSYAQFLTAIYQEQK